MVHRPSLPEPPLAPYSDLGLIDSTSKPVYCYINGRSDVANPVPRELIRMRIASTLISSTFYFLKFSTSENGANS